MIDLDIISATSRVVISKEDRIVQFCIDYKAGVNILLTNANYSTKKINSGYLLFSIHTKCFYHYLILYTSFYANMRNFSLKAQKRSYQ